MPVYELLENMPYEEFLGWLNYFEQRPVGWREDDRTMKLLQAQGVTEKPHKIFQSLGKIYSPNRKVDSKIAESLKGSAMFPMIISAKGGESLSE